MPKRRNRDNNFFSEEEEIPETKKHKNETPKLLQLYYNTRETLALSAAPSALVCREKERSIISSFWKECAEHVKPGSIYISGSPGTGKTALITEIINSMTTDPILPHPKVVVLNCMNLQDVDTKTSRKKTVFHCIASLLKLDCDVQSDKELEQQIADYLCRPRSSVIVLVLDEIDQLLTNKKSDRTLHSIFGWTTLPNSHCVVIGIANAMDLTERHLPDFGALSCKPILVHFQRYSKDQICAILKDRLARCGDVKLIDDKAIEMLAGKVSNHSGDIRKALDICRQAIEKEIFKLERMSKEDKLPDHPNVINLPTMASLCNNVLGSPMVQQLQELSHHGQLLMVAALSLSNDVPPAKKSKTATDPMIKMYAKYTSYCTQVNLPAISKSEVADLVYNMASQGLLSLTKTGIFPEASHKDIVFAFENVRYIKPVLPAN